MFGKGRGEGAYSGAGAARYFPPAWSRSCVYTPTSTTAQLVRAALAESIDKMRAMPPGPFEVEPPPGIQA